MWKVAILGTVLLLAGCKDTVIVEDNGPDRLERERAMIDCVGEFIVEKASDELRVACTQAIYGGKQ
jgi:hypothetical protein